MSSHWSFLTIIMTCSSMFEDFQELNTLVCLLLGDESFLRNCHPTTIKASLLFTLS